MKGGVRGLIDPIGLGEPHLDAAHVEQRLEAHHLAQAVGVRLRFVLHLRSRAVYGVNGRVPLPSRLSCDVTDMLSDGSSREESHTS